MLSHSARKAVIGLNTPSPWPLNQYTESLSGCNVIITAKGNVHASVNVRECVCLFGVKSIFLFGWSSCQLQQIDARNRRIVSRIWTQNKLANEAALCISDWKRPDYTSMRVCLFSRLRKVAIDPKIHLKDLKPHSHQPSLLQC